MIKYVQRKGKNWLSAMSIHPAGWTYSLPSNPRNHMAQDSAYCSASGFQLDKKRLPVVELKEEATNPLVPGRLWEKDDGQSSASASCPLASGVGAAALGTWCCASNLGLEPGPSAAHCLHRP